MDLRKLKKSRQMAVLHLFLSWMDIWFIELILQYLNYLHCLLSSTSLLYDPHLRVSHMRFAGLGKIKTDLSIIKIFKFYQKYINHYYKTQPFFKNFYLKTNEAKIDLTRLSYPSCNLGSPFNLT